MKTVIFDNNGDKLKAFDRDVNLQEGDEVMWLKTKTVVKDSYYDIANDTRFVFLDLDVKPEDVKGV